MAFSYQTKYKLEFRDIIQEEFNLYTLSIKKLQEPPFSGVTLLKGTGSPIKLNYNLVQDDILYPFRSSYLDISFYKENLSDDFSDLFISENKQFQVELKKNDVVFWQGWISPQLTSEPFASPPYMIKIRAYDGLHLLKEIPYFDSTDVFQATSNLFNDRYGYHSLTDIIEKCIYNTGVLNDVNYFIFVKNTNTTNYFSDFVGKTRVHHQTFLNGESDSMNMQEVLKKVLEALGATIYQRDGSWCIVKVSDFTDPLLSVVKERSSWRADAVPTATNYILTSETHSSDKDNISQEVDFLQIDNSALLTLQYPLKDVIISQDFDHNMITDTTIDSVKDLGASAPSGEFLFTEWDASGAVEAVVLRSEDNQSQAKDLNKSFIEVDLQVNSLDLNFNDEALYYPVTHDCTIDSSTISGLKAEARIRPLGRSQVDNEAAAVIFSPKLIWTDAGTPYAKGFGIGGVTRNFVLSSYSPTTLPTQANIVNDSELSIGTANYAPELTKSNLIITASNSSNYVVTISTSAYPTWYVSGTLSGSHTITKADFTGTLPLGKMSPAEYSVSIETTSANITSIQWDIEGVINGSGGGTSPWTAKWLGIPNVANKDTTEIAANAFNKDFNESQGDYAAARIVTNKINDWISCEITASDGWVNNIDSLKVQMFIFGGAKFLDASGSYFSFPYTNTYDVSYTNIKMIPLVTSSKFTPKKQEYTISQDIGYSNKKTKKIGIGSGLFNTGSDIFVGFPSDVSSDAKKSWTDWSDTLLTNTTMQHLLAASYMKLYNIPVRRLDGVHYGNYKYGDRLVLKVNGSTETLNGSQGKFFPMKVSIDLKIAKTKFSGDDLINNYGSTLFSNSTKTIKWIGDNGITETETLT